MGIHHGASRANRGGSHELAVPLRGLPRSSGMPLGYVSASSGSLGTENEALNVFLKLGQKGFDACWPLFEVLH